MVANDLGAFTDVFFRDRGPMRIGDLNGVVDNTDVDILNQNWGDCPCCAADLDGDATVGTLDLLILLANWG
ncbi:MAG: hypothetical protein O6941_01685 [Planctomycetota bacterium]|nr:hypothetical protein [Planctomycetota bacterium]MCZ6611319.1 hypothetical protein [Planctomycetota bacterium]